MNDRGVQRSASFCVSFAVLKGSGALALDSAALDLSGHGGAVVLPLARQVRAGRCKPSRGREPRRRNRSQTIPRHRARTTLGLSTMRKPAFSCRCSSRMRRGSAPIPTILQHRHGEHRSAEQAEDCCRCFVSQGEALCVIRGATPRTWTSPNGPTELS